MGICAVTEEELRDGAVGLVPDRCARLIERVLKRSAERQARVKAGREHPGRDVMQVPAHSDRAVDYLRGGMRVLLGVADIEKDDPQVLARPFEHLDQLVCGQWLGPIRWSHHKNAIRRSVTAELNHVRLMPVDIRDQVQRLRGEPRPEGDPVTEPSLFYFEENFSYFLAEVNPFLIRRFGCKE